MPPAFIRGEDAEYVSRLKFAPSIEFRGAFQWDRLNSRAEYF
jgi:hypothetical protein